MIFGLISSIDLFLQILPEVFWDRKAILNYFMSKVFLFLGDLMTLFILQYQSRANTISNCSCAQKGSIQLLKQNDEMPFLSVFPPFTWDEHGRVIFFFFVSLGNMFLTTFMYCKKLLRLLCLFFFFSVALFWTGGFVSEIIYISPEETASDRAICYVGSALSCQRII